MILDRLRQENSSGSLTMCLNVAFDMLEDIKAGLVVTFQQPPFSLFCWQLQHFLRGTTSKS